MNDDGDDTFPITEHDHVVILVDPYSTGCLIGKEMYRRGYGLIALWTRGFSESMKSHVPKAAGIMQYIAQVDEAETIAETAQRCQEAFAAATGGGHSSASNCIVACVAGGEAGVDVADALSEYMGLRTNGTEIKNRRDKKVQQELVRSVGLRSVRQAGSSKFEDVQDFLQTEPYPIVLKPIESAGSDGVKLCHDFQEAKDHFATLMQSQMVNGGQCPAVLCQEFLRGKEYVVDHVSRDGVHKTSMVWVYDKRPANGCPFVYFGCVPVDADSEVAKILIPYVRGVLDALGIKNGPSHGEVMMTDQGPCLIEMNCRAHGGDGNWRPLCRALTGMFTII
jgi:biotin carboxylase